MTVCFSAEASFASAAVLLPAGIYCMKTAWVRCRAWLPFAALPLIFGVQQACEGWVWLGLRDERGDVLRASSLCYLYFALAFWPFWVPLCALCLEPRRRIRRFLALVTLVGLAIGLTLYLPLLFDPSYLVTQVMHHSIQYDITGALAFRIMPRPLWQLGYVAVVASPMLVAAFRPLTYFGIALLLSVVVSQLFFNYAFASVWCFFAAVLSAYLCRFFYLQEASTDLRAGGVNPVLVGSAGDSAIQQGVYTPRSPDRG